MRNHLIFDLDGTLIDSNAECLAILQEMIDERGLARRLDPVVSAPYMSFGGRKMVTDLLGDARLDPDEDLKEFRARYAKRPTPVQSLFEGVACGLAQLKKAGYRLAVCTNKPANLCHKVLSETGLIGHFCSIVGTAPGLQPKPAPDMLLRILDELAVEPHHCMFIGDSELDEAIAATANIPFLLMRYGYGAADWKHQKTPAFDSFTQLVEHLAPVTTHKQNSQTA